MDVRSFFRARPPVVKRRSYVRKAPVVRRQVRRAVARMKPMAKTAIRAIAKQVVRQENENKFVGGIVENSNLHNGAISNADIYPILPPVVQGTGYNQRIAHKIRPKYLEYRLRVALNESANLTTPYHVDIWCLTSKRVKSYNVPGGLGGGAIDTTQLLDGGSGANLAYDGSTMNALLPINREEFNVLAHRSFKLTTSTAENHKGISYREMVIRIKCPATLVYDTTNYAENFAPFTVCGWSRDDGVTPSGLSTHVTVTSWCILHYEDA